MGSGYLLFRFTGYFKKANLNKKVKIQLHTYTWLKQRWEKKQIKWNKMNIWRKIYFQSRKGNKMWMDGQLVNNFPPRNKRRLEECKNLNGTLVH